MELKNASDDFKRANPHLYGSGETTKLEHGPRDAALAATQAQSGYTGRVYVRITSVRKRPLDPDNICEKYLLDCLRYAGFLRDDTEAEISLKTDQRKAGKGEEEHTIIQLDYL